MYTYVYYIMFACLWQQKNGPSRLSARGMPEGPDGLPACGTPAQERESRPGVRRRAGMYKCRCRSPGCGTAFQVSVSRAWRDRLIRPAAKHPS